MLLIITYYTILCGMGATKGGMGKAVEKLNENYYFASRRAEGEVLLP